MPRHYAIDGCDVGRLLATWHMAKHVRPASGAERLAGAVCHATTRLTDVMWAGCWQRGIWLNRRGRTCSSRFRCGAISWRGMPRHYAIDGCDVGRLLATWHMAKHVRPASGAERLAGAACHASTRLTDVMWASCWQRGIWLNMFAPLPVLSN
ncbi:hypothetical protein ACQKDS_10205 [Serratia sp. NPDC078593]|uniref:hypothetical protein n=1 Tax=unclassified Serratia (in: enterobacteria) TaxID=2647522 RepID=UPI003D02E647